MYQKILIAIDGTPLAQKALTHGLALAKSVGASVTVVTVTEALSLAIDFAHAELQGTEAFKEYERVIDNSAGNILSVATEEAMLIGVACETHHVGDSHPAEGILEAANDARCDLIIISSHGRRGLDRVLLGSVANEVLTHTKIPVLIVR